MFPLLLLAALSAEPQTIVGRLHSSHDGDTFRIVVDGEVIKVRLSGIDCPELDQPFGHAARLHLEEILHDKELSFVHRGRYHRKRLLGVLYVDGRDINLQLVADGLAWHDMRYSNGIDLWRAELNAREAKIGLWADPLSIAPWEWRKGKR